MNGRHALRVFALLAALLAGLGTAAAHEATMAVMELTEVRPYAYLLRWTIEPTIPIEQVEIRVPPNCIWREAFLDCGPPGLIGQISIANLGFNLSAVMMRVHALSGEDETYTLTAASPTASVLGGRAPDLHTWIGLGWTYANLGFDHILLGIDHLLFVLGLMWLVPGGWRLVKTITAFTVGHSLSLAAAAFGLIGVAEKPLNATIALSIAFVGAEIVRLRRGEAGLTVRYPWAVAAGFGLLHGIGYAGALAALGIQRKLLPVALLSFNVGVEIGQLAFVLLVLALFWAHRTLAAELPARLAVLPGYAIGIVAMYWFIGRMSVLIAS